MRIAMLAGVIVLGLCGGVFAQQAIDSPKMAGDTSRPPAGVSAAVAPAVHGSFTTRPVEDSGPKAAAPDSKFELVLEAAARLEAAGMPDEAQRLRRHVEQERKALSARLQALEKEAEHLRRLIGQMPHAPGQAQQILIHVRVLELQVDKIRRLGFDFARCEPGGMGVGQGRSDGCLLANPCQGFACVVDRDDAVLRVLEALGKDGLARVLAEPMIVTLSGRPASLSVGGEFPVPTRSEAESDAVRFRPYGTQVDVVPTLSSDQNVRLELRCRLSELEPERAVMIGQAAVPAVRTREFDTCAELPLGRTLVIGGLTQTRVAKAPEPTSSDADVPNRPAAQPDQSRETTQLVILVTPELVSTLGPGQAGFGALPHAQPPTAHEARRTDMAPPQ